MSIANLWHYLAGTISAIPRSGLLIAMVIAMFAGWVGAMMARRKMPMGIFVRRASTLFLACVLITVVLQLSRFDPRLEVTLPEFVLPEQVVEGSETRIRLGPDGHFWLRAEINGVPASFLVDTGATLNAVSQDLADQAGLKPRRGGLPISMNTANGLVAAQLSTIEEIRFGNVAARGLDVVIMPNLGETNVVGMNTLSRLASWRVEGDQMILVPNNPQAPIELR